MPTAPVRIFWHRWENVNKNGKIWITILSQIWIYIPSDITVPVAYLMRTPCNSIYTHLYSPNVRYSLYGLHEAFRLQSVLIYYSFVTWFDYCNAVHAGLPNATNESFFLPLLSTATVSPCLPLASKANTVVCWSVATLRYVVSISRRGEDRKRYT